MAGENTTTTLTGLFKEVYGPDIIKIVPEANRLVKGIKFSEAEKLGKQYNRPVLLTQENGVTYAGADAGAFTLNGPLNAVMKNATLNSSQLLLQGRIDYEAAAKASKGKEAFADATELLVKNMLETIAKRLEIMFLYGQTGIGAVNANTSSSTTFVVSAASWAPAIWAGLEGAELEIFSADGTTKRGTTHVVSSVAFSTRTVTLASAATLTATDLVFFRSATTTTGSAFSHNECAGVDAILTTSGNLFGISNSTYSLWKGETYAAGGALTPTKLFTAVTQCVSKGLMEDTVAYVSPKAFQNLANPFVDTGSSNARRVDASYSKNLEVGAESITLYGPAGKMVVQPHLFVKEGEAFVLPLKRFKRVGATDVTFNTPGRGDEMFIQLQSNAGYELRCYANQALFCEMPGRCVKITGVS